MALGGGLLLVNFVLWMVVGRSMFASALAGTSMAKAALLWSGKLVLLFGGLLYLLTTFPIAAVALGGSVVVTALMLQALVKVATELRVDDDPALRVERTA